MTWLGSDDYQEEWMDSLQVFSQLLSEIKSLDNMITLRSIVRGSFYDIIT